MMMLQRKEMVAWEVPQGNKNMKRMTGSLDSRFSQLAKYRSEIKMGFFTKKNKELEALCRKVDLEAENNYKDAAQEAFGKLEKRFEEICAGEKIKEKTKLYYKEEIEKRRKILRNFHH